MVRQSGAPVIEEAQERLDVVGRSAHVVGLGDRQHVDVVRRKGELGDDAEVPAASSETPEEIGILCLARGHDLTSGGHDSC